MTKAYCFPELKSTQELNFFVQQMRLLCYESQSRAAEFAPVSRTTISRYENGTMEPSLEYLTWLLYECVRVCQAKGMRADQVQLEAIRVFNDLRVYYPDEPRLTSWDEFVALFRDRSLGSRKLKSESWGMAPPEPALFVGRETSLVRIREMVGSSAGVRQPHSQRNLTVLRGWPGIGKSVTMAQLGHDATLQRLYPDNVLWAQLGPRPDTLMILRQWALSLGISTGEQTVVPQHVRNLINGYLRERSTLILLDDVWRVEDFNELNVGGSNCAIVTSTRFTELADTIAPSPARIYTLPVLSDESAIELLKILCPQVVLSHRDEIAELVRYLEGLPLSLQVAGRLLHMESRHGWSVGQLISELKTGQSILSTSVPGDMRSDEYRGSKTVSMLLSKSTDLLSSELQQYFALLSIYPHKPISFDLDSVKALWQVEDAIPYVRELTARGLLEVVELGGQWRYQMHALLSAHASKMLEGFDETL